MRLIDADAFTEQIAAAVLKKGTGEAAELGTNIIRLVDAQPTAYNVEKVVEQIQKIGVGGKCRNYCEKYDWTVGACTGECTGYVIGKVLEIVRNGGKVDKNRGWIPVEERLPEDSLDSVIGWDDYRKCCCFVQYYRGRWRLPNNDIESVKITAWQLLPEAYRKEQ